MDLRKASLTVLTLIIIVPGALSIEFGISASNGDDETSYYSYYDGDNIAVTENNWADASSPEISTSRFVSGSGQIETEQGFQGNCYDAYSYYYGSQVESYKLKSTSSISPNHLDVSQSLSSENGNSYTYLEGYSSSERIGQMAQVSPGCLYFSGGLSLGDSLQSHQSVLASGYRPIAVGYSGEYFIDPGVEYHVEGGLVALGVQKNGLIKGNLAAKTTIGNDISETTVSASNTECIAPGENIGLLAAIAGDATVDVEISNAQLNGLDVEGKAAVGLMGTYDGEFEGSVGANTLRDHVESCCEDIALDPRSFVIGKASGTVSVEAVGAGNLQADLANLQFDDGYGYGSAAGLGVIGIGDSTVSGSLYANSISEEISLAEGYDIDASGLATLAVGAAGGANVDLNDQNVYGTGSLIGLGGAGFGGSSIHADHIMSCYYPMTSFTYSSGTNLYAGATLGAAGMAVGAGNVAYDWTSGSEKLSANGAFVSSGALGTSCIVSSSSLSAMASKTSGSSAFGNQITLTGDSVAVAAGSGYYNNPGSSDGSLDSEETIGTYSALAITDGQITTFAGVMPI